MSRQSPEADRLRGVLAELEDQALRFTRASEGWAKELPPQLWNMDLQFMLNNVEQFEPFRVLGDLMKAQGLLLELGEARSCIQRKEPLHLGLTVVALSDADGFTGVEKALAEFEGKTNRPLFRPDKRTNHQYHRELEGLKLGEGLVYLREAGVLYYGLQMSLNRARLNAHLSRQPQVGLGLIEVEGVGVLALCGVCRALMSPASEVAGPARDSPAPLQQVRGEAPRPSVSAVPKRVHMVSVALSVVLAYLVVGGI